MHPGEGRGLVHEQRASGPRPPPGYNSCMRILAAAVLPLLIAAAPPPGVPQKLTVERVFDSPSLSGPVPRLPKLSPDGRYLAILRNRPDDLQRYDLWAFDRQTGKWSMLVDSQKLGTGQALS